ncbi:MAG: TetR family transcriptional regulator [Coriobacteriales bacterium]|nr:TetR family transcriptional regulator [Coriobacteriales bacterium]
MAIDVESLVIDTLLSLVEGQGVPLERVTVKRLLEESGVSRQTFYNHFLDKNDLICQVYEQRMVRAFNGAQEGFAYRDELVAALREMRAHGTFLRQACKMSGQNCLAQHMLERATNFDLEWHQRLWGEDPMPEELRLATVYHVTASVQMSLSWILSGFAANEEELADLISRMREIGMEAFFAQVPASNPYAR